MHRPVMFRSGARVGMWSAALVLALACAGGPATAEPPRSQVVRTTDLDLSDRAGARLLDLRILHAASALCGTPSAVDVRGRARHAACRADARASASAARAQMLAAARQDRRGPDGGGVEYAGNR